MKKNNSGIFFGLFIIFIGIVLILSQFGMLDLDKIVNFLSDHISTIISLLLIVTGVNLVFDKYNGVKFFAWTAFFAVLLISGCIYGGATENKIERSTNKAYIRPFTEEKLPETEEGRLKMKLSGQNLKIGSTESGLIKGDMTDSGVQYKVDYKKNNKVADIDFKMESGFFLENVKNLVSMNGSDSKSWTTEEPLEVLLNTDVLWDIDLKFGGTDGEIDLSSLKVEEFELDGGAGNIKLILGDRHPSTKVDIDAGAANFKIFVPKNSGIKVEVDGLLSSVSFKDLTLEQTKKKTYVSPEYDNAKK